MSNLKISELSDAATLTGAELVPLVQSGANKKTLLSTVAAYVLAFLGVGYKGADSDLAARLTALESIARSNDIIFGKKFTGQYYTNSPKVQGTSSLLMALGDLRIVPFWNMSSDFTIDRIGLSIPTTASAAGSHKAILGVYESDADGMPTNLLATFGELTGLNTTGTKEITGLSFTFERGKIYWLAYLGDNTATIRILTAAGHTPNLGCSNTAGTIYQSFVRTGQIYANGLPATYNAVAGDRSSNAPLMFLMRAA